MVYITGVAVLHRHRHRHRSPHPWTWKPRHAVHDSLGDAAMPFMTPWIDATISVLMNTNVFYLQWLGVVVCVRYGAVLCWVRRCTEAERQLAALRDLEGDGADGDSDDEGGGGGAGADRVGGSSAAALSSFSSPGLQQRKGVGVGSGAGGGGGAYRDSWGRGRAGRAGPTARVISGPGALGSQAGAGVASAVNLIDGGTMFTGRCGSQIQ